MIMAINMVRLKEGEMNATMGKWGFADYGYLFPTTLVLGQGCDEYPHFHPIGAQPLSQTTGWAPSSSHPLPYHPVAP